MKLLIALSLLSVAVALPRPDPIKLPVPELPAIEDNLEIPAEVVKVADAPESFQEHQNLIEVHPVVAPDVDNSVHIFESPEELPARSEAVKVVDHATSEQIDLTHEKVQVVNSPIHVSTVSAPKNEIEMVHIVDTAVVFDQDSGAVNVVDSPVLDISQLLPNQGEDTVKVVNSQASIEHENVKVVDVVDTEADHHGANLNGDTNLEYERVNVDNPLSFAFDDSQFVKLVDHPIIRNEGFEPIRALSGFAGTPLQIPDHVIIVGSPMEVLDAIHRIVEQVRVVDSPEVYQPPRIYKYQDPFLR